MGVKCQFQQCFSYSISCMAAVCFIGGEGSWNSCIKPLNCQKTLTQKVAPSTPRNGRYSKSQF